MRRLTAMEVHACKVAELGLDPAAVDLTSTEAIAGALRRAAGFLCPCGAATLVRGVTGPLQGLVEDLDAVKILAEETLEAVIALGDIVEHREFGEDASRGPAALLYAAPASFVSRQSGAVILFGIASEQLSALPEEMEPRIEYASHVRKLSPLPGEDLRTELAEYGLIELSYEGWLGIPPAETPTEHISRLGRFLASVQPSRDVPGLSLLDPARPVRFYRGRWVEPRSQTGCFVARRRQAYGADLWCYVQLHNGNPERLIDFPLAGVRWRGCDDAWCLQLAIDAQCGKPQQFRVRGRSGGTVVLEFFSPLPMWAKRRWDAVGEAVPSPGCLFAYRFAKSDLEEELRFAYESLWLAELS